MRVLEHKGAVTGLRYLLPPPSMLDPTVWQPARRLTVLQKGADETEPLACRLFSRTDRGTDQGGMEDDMGEAGWREGELTEAIAAKGGQEEENGLSVEELKLINKQLYQFAVKNILQSK